MFCLQFFFVSVEIAMKGSKDIVSGQFGPVWRQQRKIAHSAIRYE